MGLNRVYMGGVERSQRNVGAVSLQKLACALGMSLSELFTELKGAGASDG